MSVSPYSRLKVTPILSYSFKKLRNNPTSFRIKYLACNDLNHLYDVLLDLLAKMKFRFVQSWDFLKGISLTYFLFTLLFVKPCIMTCFHSNINKRDQKCFSCTLGQCETIASKNFFIFYVCHVCLCLFACSILGHELNQITIFIDILYINCPDINIYKKLRKNIFY